VGGPAPPRNKSGGLGPCGLPGSATYGYRPPPKLTGWIRPCFYQNAHTPPSKEIHRIPQAFIYVYWVGFCVIRLKANESNWKKIQF